MIGFGQRGLVIIDRQGYVPILATETGIMWVAWVEVCPSRKSWPILQDFAPKASSLDFRGITTLHDTNCVLL